MKSWKRLMGCAALGLFAMISTGAALAQNYPTKTVTIVVPYPPGGTNDIVVRILSRKLTEQLGQPFIVENRAGASGNIGAEAVARSPADGYTLLLVTTGHTIHPSLYEKLGYDISSDLAPVSQLVSGPLVVTVNPSLPVNNVRELIALAKSKPGELNYASAGIGSSTHLATELLSSMAGIKMNHVPYKGSAPAMTDVMAGHAQLVMDFLLSAMPHIQSGKLKAIAVTSATRSPALQDVPTVAESGVPGFEVVGWNGMMAPIGTPKGVIATLNAELKKALESADVKDRLAEQGFSAAWSTPEAFGAHIQSELDRWKTVVETSGAKID